MRTPRSGGNKKTPPAKKATSNAAASSGSTPETVPGPETKTTPPKSGSGTRGARNTGKRSNRKAATVYSGASSATSDPPLPAAAPEVVLVSDMKPEQKEEAAVLGDLNTALTSTSPEKKPAAAKKSSPSLVKAKTSTMELQGVKNESVPKTGETETPVRTEVDEQGRPLVGKKPEMEQKTVIPDEEPEKPSVEEKGEEPVDETKREEGDSIADSYESKGGLIVNLTKEEDSSMKAVVTEDEDRTMEEYVGQEGVDVPGDEETTAEEKENEIDEQVEMLDIIKERKKKKEQEIFVGGLDRDATEEDVRKVFEKIGVVEDIRLHKDFTTNKNKGFAFVKFADKEQANRAILELKNPIINGKRCGIARSEDNDTLFLGNICNTWTKEAIKQRLKDYGVEGVENITLVGDTQNEGLSRGFAFVEFSCHEYAMNAYKRLQKPDVVFGHAEWTAKVAFAEPLREPDPEVMAQVKSVFVDGMPPYWDEDRVKEHFKDYGEIEGIVLARNMPTAKRMDFGFVNYTTHEAAVACAEAVNNTELGDGKSKMKVRARLANPLPKTQAVKGGMRGGFRIGHAGMGGFSRFGKIWQGRVPFARGGFQGGRGFHIRGHGRGGRFPFFAEGNMDNSHFRFRGRQPFGARGGRGSFRGDYEGVNEEFPPRLDTSRSRHGGFPFSFDGDFGGPSDGGHYAEDPYYYGDVGHGVKRPFSMIDESRFLEPGSRVRPRYNPADPLAGEARYQDRMRGSGSMYSHDYYGSDYGGSGYSSLYGGEGSGSRYYY
ncbi:unnamed protein product [Spirodela intermedia]|uniref:RRM domain-containing protein n=1 Tax=Spirodela intermedia TaxID=51605 RepID=A0A7I8JTA1_SPIIN|nr:unnamed protein product [Spirodela intermedia]CAA6673406.1 unnamed protein product [Spirodela intermedia]